MGWVVVEIHPHARERMVTRGASETEVVETVERGESFPAKFGRTGFRRNFVFNSQWRGQSYSTKQVEAYAVRENDGWTVITILTRYF